MADPKNPDINTVFLANVPTPGLAIVEGSSGSPRKWQELGGYALSGAANRALIAAQREAVALSAEEFRRRFPGF